MSLPLVMVLYCEKLEAETQTENWQWGVWLCLKTAYICDCVLGCPGLTQYMVSVEVYQGPLYPQSK